MSWWPVLLMIGVAVSACSIGSSIGLLFICWRGLWRRWWNKDHKNSLQRRIASRAHSRGTQTSTVGTATRSTSTQSTSISTGSTTLTSTASTSAPSTKAEETKPTSTDSKAQGGSVSLKDIMKRIEALERRRTREASGSDTESPPRRRHKSPSRRRNRPCNDHSKEQDSGGSRYRRGRLH